MRSSIFFATFIVILGFAAYLANWFDLYHAAIGLPALLLFFVPAWGRLPSPGAKSRPAVLRRNRRNYGSLRFVSWGAFAGVGAAFYLTLVFAVADRLPLDRQWLDSDQAPLEQVVTRLESRNYWQDAASEIRNRLARPTSDDWRRALQERLFRDLIQAARASDESQATGFLREARELAQTGGFDGSAADDLLAWRAEREKHDANVADLNAQTSHLHDALAQAEQQRHSQSSTISEYETQLAEAREANERLAGEAEHTKSTARQRMFEALIDSAHLVEDLDQRQTLIQQALERANQWQLDPAIALRGLEDIAAERERRAPTALSDTCRAAIRDIVADLSPPCCIVELTVEDNQGRSIEGLTAKDFSVLVNQTPAASPWVVSAAAPSERALSLAILFDHSQSTVGEPIAAAKRGLMALLTTLPSETEVALVTFNEAVVQCADWTADPQMIASAINTVSAGGNTALHGAILHGIELIEKRPGSKALVLFTDGHNTIGNHVPDDVIDRCRRAKTPVYAIGLQTDRLDIDFLKRIAHETQGRLFSAETIEQLNDTFAEASRELRRSRYWLAVPTSVPVDRLSIQIGAKPGIRVEHRVRPTNVAPR